MHVGTMWCHCRLVAFDDYLELSLLMLPLLLSDFMSELMPDFDPYAMPLLPSHLLLYAYHKIP